jgi:hypothetical protein
VWISGNGAGNPITNVTDSTGYYLFNGLTESGDYTVTVLTATLPGGSGANTWDRDGNQNNQTTVALDVTSINGGDTILNADFGYNNIQSVITGTIWHDVNRSGTTSPDTGEPWLSGVVVRLYDSNSVLVATATTGVSGAFTFLGMFDGDYTVQVDTNSGPLATGTWAQTFDTDGTNTAHEVTVTVPLGGQGRADYSYVRTGSSGTSATRSSTTGTATAPRTATTRAWPTSPSGCTGTPPPTASTIRCSIRWSPPPSPTAMETISSRTCRTETISWWWTAPIRTSRRCTT